MDQSGATALPFAGVTVLDCSDEATALAARWLADLGARVIRVEASDGDRLRRRPPFVDGVPGLERSLAHLRYNGGKESVALALDLPEAWEIADRLAGSADVVIAPLDKSPNAARFFDEDRMAAVHGDGPGVVDTVFRFGGPRTPPLDLMGVAAGGLLYLNGFPEDAPNLPAGKLAYKQVSLAVAEAAGALILRKLRFGRAGRVTVSMEEAVAWTTMQTANANFYHWHGRRPTRYGLTGLGATGRTIFPTKDERFVSFTINPPRWSNYVRWIEQVTGDGSLAGEEWSDPAYQYAHIADLNEKTLALCRALNRDELVDEGQRLGLLVTPVHSMADLAADPHLAARGYLEQVPHPQLERELTMPRPPFISTAYTTSGRPAPTLGQHTRQVLRDDAALDDDAIDGLIAMGIARCGAPTEGASHA
jgi:crotonobetainyl-CoA:carnitine CoA-transferase CaiB-like acyl-CoA transferase